MKGVDNNFSEDNMYIMFSLEFILCCYNLCVCIKPIFLKMYHVFKSSSTMKIIIIITKFQRSRVSSIIVIIIIILLLANDIQLLQISVF